MQRNASKNRNNSPSHETGFLHARFSLTKLKKNAHSTTNTQKERTSSRKREKCPR